MTKWQDQVCHKIALCESQLWIRYAHFVDLHNRLPVQLFTCSFLRSTLKFRRVRGDMIEVCKFVNNIHDSVTTG